LGQSVLLEQSSAPLHVCWHVAETPAPDCAAQHTSPLAQSVGAVHESVAPWHVVPVAMHDEPCCVTQQSSPGLHVVLPHVTPPLPPPLLLPELDVPELDPPLPEDEAVPELEPPLPEDDDAVPELEPPPDEDPEPDPAPPELEEELPVWSPPPLSRVEPPHAMAIGTRVAHVRKRVRRSMSGLRGDGLDPGTPPRCMPLMQTDHIAIDFGRMGAHIPAVTLQGSGGELSSSPVVIFFSGARHYPR
jgi:hypothetical protein